MCHPLFSSGDVPKYELASLVLRTGGNNLVAHIHATLHLRCRLHPVSRIDFSQKTFRLRHGQTFQSVSNEGLGSQQKCEVTYFFPMQPRPPEANAKKSLFLSSDPPFSSPNPKFIRL